MERKAIRPQIYTCHAYIWKKISFFNAVIDHAVKENIVVVIAAGKKQAASS